MRLYKDRYSRSRTKYISSRHIIGLSLSIPSLIGEKNRIRGQSKKKDGQSRTETSLKKIIYHTRILLHDPDETFGFIRKILIFIPGAFLCACLICHARHKPKKARNQSRSSSQEHELNHFLFARPTLSFHRGH